MTHTLPLVAIRDLKPGDLIDLAGDAWADPNGDIISYECEYATVAAVEIETPDCTCVHFEGDASVGFPPNHMVPIGGHDTGYDIEESV